MATVTGLTATHRGGQTFLVGTKNAGSNGSTTYAIRRSSSAFTSSSDGTLIATLDANSYRWLYSDAAYHNLTAGLIITDGGAALASTQILAVITTHSGETGTWHYAAFTSDDPTTVSAGVNTASVAETYQAVPGAIRVGTATDGIHNTRYYMAWEDISTWNTTEWGYYGHLFSVNTPVSGISPPYPMLLELHSAGGTQYLEPIVSAQDAIQGVTVNPVDMDWTGFTEPYTGSGMGNSRWTARFHTANDLWMTCTEDRVIRYVKIVRDNATGDGFDFGIDSDRVYAMGGSLGSAAMHYVSHYPAVFAAGTTQVGWFDATAYGTGSTKKVNASDGLTLTQYLDMAYYAANSALRPLSYAIGSYDGTVLPAPYTAGLAALETYHQPFFAEWQDVDHGGFSPVSYTQWDHHIAGSGHLRFDKSESTPAFGSASTSTTLPTFPGHFTGQRNGTIDWQSALHTITGGSAISDGASTFAISLISSSQSTGTTVTIRNAQTFLPVVGSTIAYSTNNGQSGSGTLNADGSVTVPNLTIPTSAMRLTITATPPVAHFASCFAGAIR